MSICITFMALCALVSAKPAWLTPRTYDLLKGEFSKMDYDESGVIEQSELAHGILTEVEYEDGVHRKHAKSWIPTSYTCIPSIDFNDFVDCMAFRVRRDMMVGTVSKKQLALPMDFDDALLEYFGTCDDVMPEGQRYQQYGDYCEDLVQMDHTICYEGSPYCKMSCRHCEPTLFDGKPLTGSDGQIVERGDKYSQSSVHFPRDPNFVEREPEQVQNKRQTQCNAVTSTRTGYVHLMSDQHLEPWYRANSSTTGRISRFSGASASNMWQCRQSGSSTQRSCRLNGHSNPPFELYESAVEYLRRISNPNSSLVIVGGDSQTHSLTSNTSSSRANSVREVMRRSLDTLLQYYPPANILYAAGNNDGDHNNIFGSGSSSTVNSAYADRLVNRGVVTNALRRSYDSRDQVGFFRRTGYYMKQLPRVFPTSFLNENYYAIVLNTNLGRSNERQRNAFRSDMAWIASQRNAKVLIVGHHPNSAHGMPDVLSTNMNSMIKGIVAGHVHYFRRSNSRMHAIIPSVSQATGSGCGVLSGSFSSNGDLNLRTAAFSEYGGSRGSRGSGARWRTPHRTCWGDTSRSHR